MERRDCIIIGAGPCGLSAAVELKKRGFQPLVIDKGCIVNSVYGFPSFMNFFSTPDLLELGGLPFITQGEKPTRLEALKYYRAVCDHFELDLHQYETVTRIDRQASEFVVSTEKKDQQKAQYVSANIVVATGYFDNPNKLGIPGENLQKVYHYFKDAHPYFGQKVAVIGGKNSAVDAAMELEKAGAEVTMVYRQPAFTKSVKPWVRPVIESAIEKGKIGMYWNTTVKEITPDTVVLDQQGKRIELENDAVFALIGYYPDCSMLEAIGVNVNKETGVPEHHPDTMETNVPGVYIAGVLAAGFNANKIFIENGRFHGHAIAKDLANRNKALSHVSR